MNFFTHHLQTVRETYVEHLKFGIWASMVLMCLALASLIHAVLPFIFPGLPYKIYQYFQEKSKNRIEKIYKKHDSSC